MRFQRTAVLSVATVALLASRLPGQTTDSARVTPPIRPVPTSIPMRPSQPDTARARVPAATVQPAARKQKPRMLPRVLIGAFTGAVAGGAFASRHDAPDCYLCPLDAVPIVVSGAGAGAVVGGLLGWAAWAIGL